MIEVAKMWYSNWNEYGMRTKFKNTPNNRAKLKNKITIEF